MSDGAALVHLRRGLVFPLGRPDGLTNDEWGELRVPWPDRLPVGAAETRGGA